MKFPDDFVNKVINANCLQILDLLPDESIDAIISDPPYGEGMNYEGDDNLQKAEDLLLKFLQKSEPKIKRNGHVVIFWTMRNLDVCIDALRSAGFNYQRTLSMYLPKGAARPYLGWLPRTQAIVVGRRYLPSKASEFHLQLTEYLNFAIDKSGISKSQLSKMLNCDSRLVMKWTRPNDPSWCLPTVRFYKPLKEILKLDDQFDILLSREPGNFTNKRSDFAYKHDCYIIDNKLEKMIHPSQKPLEVLEHLVSCVCPEGGLVLDGFSGSGTTAKTCQNTKRNFIAIEISEEFCKIAADRINNIG